MLKPHTILGISPGTRTIGIAIWSNNHLSQWQIKAFKGSWGESKQRDILYSVKTIIDGYGITDLAIKKQDVAYISPALQQLVSEIQLMAKRKEVKIKVYTLTELKRFCSDDRKLTKAQMIRFVAEKNPVLHYEYNKEQKNRNPYYAKMFEAIIAAMLYKKGFQSTHLLPSPYPHIFL
jgi:Holliday junction resolvasome RuvABC endonuclease subunit